MSLPTLSMEHLFEPSSCLRSALEAVDTGMVVLEKQTQRWCFMNRAARDLLGSDEGIETVKTVLAELACCFRTGPPAPSEMGQSQRNVRIGDKTIALTVYCGESDGYGVVLLKEVAEQPLPYETSDLLDTNSPVTTMLGSLCHEIGNPLNSMKITIQVLMQNIGHFSEMKTNSYLLRTIQEIDRLDALLFSFKQLTVNRRMETREVDLKLSMMRFMTSIKDVCKTHQVEAHVSEAARFVESEPDVLQQILFNLFTNAKDAHAEKEGENLEADGRPGEPLKIRITTRKAQQPDFVQLSFSDNGAGIPPHVLPLIFRPLYTTKARGTGLGLPLVDRMVKRMGGHMRISSKVGEGTRVELFLRAVN